MGIIWDLLETFANLEDAGKFGGRIAGLSKIMLGLTSGKRRDQIIDDQIKLIRKKGYLYRAFMQIKGQGFILTCWEMDGSGALGHIGEHKPPSSDDIDERNALRFFIRNGYVEPVHPLSDRDAENSYRYTKKPRWADDVFARYDEVYSGLK